MPRTTGTKQLANASRKWNQKQNGALVDKERAKAAQYFILVFCLFEEFHEDLVYNPIENKVLKNKSCLVFSSELSFVRDALMEQFLNNDFIFFFHVKDVCCHPKEGGQSLFSSLELTFIRTSCIQVVEVYLFSWKWDINILRGWCISF